MGSWRWTARRDLQTRRSCLRRKRSFFSYPWKRRSGMILWTRAVILGIKGMGQGLWIRKGIGIGMGFNVSSYSFYFPGKIGLWGLAS